MALRSARTCSAPIGCSARRLPRSCGRQPAGRRGNAGRARQPGTLGTVTLRTGNAAGALQRYVPAGTVVTFIGPALGPAAAPPAPFTLTTIAPASALPGAPANQRRVLHFQSPDVLGIAVGTGVSGAFVVAGTTVALIRTASGSTTSDVILSQALTGSPASVTFTMQPPFVALTRRPISGTPAAAQDKLTFAAGQTDGIAAGMILEPVANLIAPGTVITAVTSTEISLSRPLLTALPANTDIHLLYALSNGIFQHVEETSDPTTFLGLGHTIVPAAVATAVIPLYDPPPKYLAVKLVAVRGSEIIPVASVFHNVLVHTEAPPADPSLLPGPNGPGHQPVRGAAPAAGAGPDRPGRSRGRIATALRPALRRDRDRPGQRPDSRRDPG